MSSRQSERSYLQNITSNLIITEKKKNEKEHTELSENPPDFAAKTATALGLFCSMPVMVEVS